MREKNVLARHFGLALLVYASFVLQLSGDVPRLTETRVPGFLFGALTIAVLTLDHWTVILWAGAIGLLSDVLRPEPLGIDMLLATAVGLTAPSFGLAVRGRSIVSVILTGFLVAGAIASAGHAARLATSGAPLEPLAMARVAVDGGLVSCLYAALILAAVRRAARFAFVTAAAGPAKPPRRWSTLE